MKIFIVLLSSFLVTCACGTPPEKYVQKVLKITEYRQNHDGEFPAKD